jgi:UDP-N-acetylmuramate--alanine ligase
VGLYLNLPTELIRQGLAKFGGVGRRFDVKGTYNGVTLIDDYAHHPAEIRSTLEAARHCGFKRLLVLFQPHRYSRTRALWDDFCHAFNQADILVITDIYSAGEKPICCITGPRLAASILDTGHRHVLYMQTMQEAIETLYREVRPGDAVMALGAGSVGRGLEQLALLLGAQVPEVHAG